MYSSCGGCVHACSCSSMVHVQKSDLARLVARSLPHEQMPDSAYRLLCGTVTMVLAAQGNPDSLKGQQCIPRHPIKAVVSIGPPAMLACRHESCLLHVVRSTGCTWQQCIAQHCSSNCSVCR